MYLLTTSKKQDYEGIDMSNPAAVGSAMKTSNAIIYRIELRKYQLMSAAHKTALKTYTPIIDNNSFTTTKLVTEESVTQK